MNDEYEFAQREFMQSLPFFISPQNKTAHYELYTYAGLSTMHIAYLQ